MKYFKRDTFVIAADQILKDEEINKNVIFEKSLIDCSRCERYKSWKIIRIS